MSSKQSPSIVLVYDAITRRALAKQRRKRLVETIIGAGAALRIRHRDERRVDAGEQHGERERLALRTENAACAARARARKREHCRRRPVCRRVRRRRAAGGQRVEPFAAAALECGAMQIIDGDRIDEHEAGNPPNHPRASKRDDRGRGVRAQPGCGSRPPPPEPARQPRSRSGSPKKPLNTLIAVAAIAMAAKISAGTTSGRRRRYEREHDHRHGRTDDERHGHRQARVRARESRQAVAECPRHCRGPKRQAFASAPRRNSNRRPEKSTIRS